ncbi:esterase [Rhizobium sp. BK376]|uniref:alpha/beta hydrolase n=1 Tax=Rhizobium sp. BK376 TaxID=2512149 RepID=UPI00104AB882|nr:esterase [Rhizobium sp. BK376]TCR82157.1 phospholipase/carboxylesterase [Rhizobium sp. BK376]
MPELEGLHYAAKRSEADARPLLLFHGSSGSELDLMSFADEIAPQRPCIFLRGGVEWESGFAFFCRNPDRTLVYEDLQLQTNRICSFIEAAIRTGLISTQPLLIGYSNGAIMASSILYRQHALAAGAVLLRPLSPAPDDDFPPMPEVGILIVAGDSDDRRAPEDARLVEEQFKKSGADVSSHVLATGHGLHETETHIVGDWILRKGF